MEGATGDSRRRGEPPSNRVLSHMLLVPDTADTTIPEGTAPWASVFGTVGLPIIEHDGWRSLPVFTSQTSSRFAKRRRRGMGRLWGALWVWGPKNVEATAGVEPALSPVRPNTGFLLAPSWGERWLAISRV